MSVSSGKLLTKGPGLPDTPDASDRPAEAAPPLAGDTSAKTAVRKPIGKRVWQAFVLAVIKVLLLVAKVVPLKAMLPVGSGLGSLGYWTVKRYRRVALRNLKIAYGEELDDAERRRIAIAVFRNFGKVAIEFPYIAAMPPEGIRAVTRLDDEDRNRIDQALAQGRGVIAFSAHLGNFELMARRFALEGYRFTVVVRNDQNAAFTRTINGLRMSGGYEVIGRGDAARPILKHLRSGGVVGVIPDQRSDDMIAPFFGRPSGTVAGPAVLALRTGAPLLPMFCIRQPDNTHKLVVMDPIYARPTGDSDADVLAVMTQVNRIMEEVIRNYPSQWLWLHDRWKGEPLASGPASSEPKGQMRSSVC